MIDINFKSISELIKAFPDEQTCINHLEKLRWNGNAISPFDVTSKVYVCAGNKYRCKNTKKYFNVRTGTLFDSTKVELQKWFLAIYIITSHKKGISSLQLGRDINVTQKTAWFMLQRIRNCFGIETEEKLKGTVEMDETYIGGKNGNRHFDKKVKNMGQNSPDKTPVIAMVERQGNVRGKVSIQVNSTVIKELVQKNIEIGTNIMTDESRSYRFLSKEYNHAHVNHVAGEYVNGNIYTNTIEGFFSLLKRGIIGIYHFTSRKHLQKYVDEFTFRYNTRKSTECARFNLFLVNTGNRLTYKNLIK